MVQHKPAHELDELVDRDLTIEATREVLRVRIVLVLVCLADHTDGIPSAQYLTDSVVRREATGMQMIGVAHQRYG